MDKKIRELKRALLASDLDDTFLLQQLLDYKKRVERPGKTINQFGLISTKGAEYDKIVDYENSIVISGHLLEDPQIIFVADREITGATAFISSKKYNPETFKKELKEDARKIYHFNRFSSLIGIMAWGDQAEKLLSLSGGDDVFIVGILDKDIYESIHMNEIDYCERFGIVVKSVEKI